MSSWHNMPHFCISRNNFAQLYYQCYMIIIHLHWILYAFRVKWLQFQCFKCLADTICLAYVFHVIIVNSILYYQCCIIIIYLYLILYAFRVKWLQIKNMVLNVDCTSVLIHKYLSQMQYSPLTPTLLSKLHMVRIII